MTAQDKNHAQITTLSAADFLEMSVAEGDSSGDNLVSKLPHGAFQVTDDITLSLAEENQLFGKGIFLGTVEFVGVCDATVLFEQATFCETVTFARKVEGSALNFGNTSFQGDVIFEEGIEHSDLERASPEFRGRVLFGKQQPTREFFHGNSVSLSLDRDHE